MSLSRLRKTNGLSLEQAAVKMGISARSLFNYEHGLRSPRLDQLEDIAKAYGVSLYAALCASLRKANKEEDVA